MSTCPKGVLGETLGRSGWNMRREDLLPSMNAAPAHTGTPPQRWIAHATPCVGCPVPPCPKEREVMASPCDHIPPPPNTIPTHPTNQPTNRPPPPTRQMYRRPPQRHHPYNTRGARRGPPSQRNNDSYLLFVLISTIFRRLDELETKPPVTIALLFLNICVHVLPGTSVYVSVCICLSSRRTLRAPATHPPQLLCLLTHSTPYPSPPKKKQKTEVLLPILGVDFRSIRDICLQPSTVVQLMMPSFSGGRGGGRGRGGGQDDSWAGYLWEAFLTGSIPSSSSSSSSSSSYGRPASDRWHEALSRTYLSAFVHGDDPHLYCT